MIGKWRALAGVFGMLSAAVASAPAVAQAVPDYGNFRALDGLFRVGVSGGSINDRYEVRNPDDVEEFFSPFDLQSRYAAYNDTLGIAGVFDVRGVEIVASYATNSPELTIRIPAFDEDGQVYTRTFNGGTRVLSYDQFEDYFDIDTPEGQDFIRRLIRALTRSSPIDPVAGNPGSTQSMLVRNSLNLGDTDSVTETEEGMNTSGDPFLIGGQVSRSSQGRFDATRFDLRVQRGFRMFEGGRGRLKIDSVASYSRVAGATAVNSQVGVALEVPVIDRRWSLEPRIGYGVAGSDRLGTFGHLINASLASRFVIRGIGRGHFVIGNAAGYSSTLSTKFTGYNLDPGLRNWSFRNGVAYDVPIALRAKGRSLSVRANYAYTKFIGDKLFTDSFHDVGLSIGFRTREESARRIHDVVRLNVGAVFASGYRSGTLGVGFRF